MMLLPLTVALIVSLGAPESQPESQPESKPGPPNVVLIVTDDQGYGDLSCYGHPTIDTPRIDALAANGVRLTQFYVASPVCSPSRAALLTGCYPKRIGMHQHVVFPPDDWGLHPDEETLAELLRARGYATGCFGKWHLGHRAGLLPTDQGFDVFAGVPYSNDMAQFHRTSETKYRFRLPWMEGAEVVEWEPDQTHLTRRQTDAAIEFIEAKAERPFFAYVPFSMPHFPIYASADFHGTSARGLYGDVIEEIDASVGRIVDALKRMQVFDDTLILFTSDNGPWLEYGLQGGSAGPLRGGKGTTWEGGMRVPFIAHWPRRIRAGVVCRDVVTALDLVPTIVAVAGAESPTRAIDGRDVGATLFDGERAETSTFLYYGRDGTLAGVRRGAWKLRFASNELFHLEHDVGEAAPVSGTEAASGEHSPSELAALARTLDEQIGAAARDRGVSAEPIFDPERRH